MELNWWSPRRLRDLFFPFFGEAESDSRSSPFVSERVRVADSAIHGKGLFAAQSIRKGHLIGQCTTRPTEEPGDYTLSLDDGQEVDVICDLKYINHSKQPNAVYFDDLTVVALREINAGEEITHDYGDEWD